MAFSWSPVETFKGWGEALNSPLGIILLIAVAIYIWLRMSGRIDNPFSNLRRGGGNNQGGQTRKPDYIIR